MATALKRNGVLGKFTEDQLTLIEIIFEDSTVIIDPTEVLVLFNEQIDLADDPMIIDALKVLKKEFMALSLVVINIIISEMPFEGEPF